MLIEDVCKAFGVEFIKIVDPYNVKETIKALVEAIRYPSVSVVIIRRVCAQVWQRELRRQKKKPIPSTVDPEKCTGCKVCIRLGCPALMFNTETNKAEIDPFLCVGCGICSQVCGYKAIKAPRQEAEQA